MPDQTHPPLLPCPWCAGEARIKQVDDLDWSPPHFYGECVNDRCHGFWWWHSTADSAAAAWNTRHVDPATLALARLGAVALSPRVAAERRKALYREAVDTPSVRERIAELLGEEGA